MGCSLAENQEDYPVAKDGVQHALRATLKVNGNLAVKFLTCHVQGQNIFVIR